MSEDQFNPEVLFDTDISDEELERQLNMYLDQGGTGPGLVSYMIHCKGPGLAQHIDRLLTILSSKVLPDTMAKLPEIPEGVKKGTV